MTSNRHAHSFDQKEEKPAPTNCEAWLGFVNAKDYGLLESAILIHLDHLDGIQSTIVMDEEYPTGVALVREATAALPLKNRLPPNDPRLEIYNMLLRALGTMRGIDHTLKHKTTEKNDLYNKARVLLQTRLANLVAKVIALQQQTTLARAEIVLLHKEFNTALIKILHNTKLSAGITTSKNIEQLLTHYRNLACAIDPAKSMVTVLKNKIRYHKTAEEIEIIHTETAHPITEKTVFQKSQLDVMRESNRIAENFHTAQQSAFQEANAAFVDLIQQDNRLLPAQTRKTIAPTVKNGYIVQNKIEVNLLKSPQTATDISTCWSLRCGAMVYVGRGETDAMLANFTRENLVQLKTAAQKLMGCDNIHITMLLTDTRIEHQDTIIRITKQESDKLGFAWSHVPTNCQGLFNTPVIDKNIAAHLPDNLFSRDINNKESRITKAGLIIEKIFAARGMINLATCASGQDRTGTAQEVATQYWIINQYKKQGIAINRLEIEKLRALGCHTAVLASLAAPGSPGMKQDSRPGNFFSPDVNTFFYRDSADTNKTVPLDNTAITQLLKPINKTRLEMFSTHYFEKISAAKEETQMLETLTEWVQKALEYRPPKESYRLFGMPTISPHAQTTITNILTMLLQLIERNHSTQQLQTFIQQSALNMIDEYGDAKKLGVVFAKLIELKTILKEKDNGVMQLVSPTTFRLSPHQNE